jgi:hypothetical protein
MLFPFSISPLPETPYSFPPPPASMRVFLYPLNHSRPSALDSPTMGHLSSLYRTKDLSFHWCLTRPSSATYAAGACVLLGWWLSPWQFCGVWLVDIAVLPTGLQTPSTPLVLSLTPPLGTPSLSPIVGCEHLPLYLSRSRRASQETAISGSFSKYFLVYTIVSRFGYCILGWTPKWVISGWSSLQSVLYTWSPYLLPWVFFLFLRRTEAPTLWSSFFFDFRVVCELYLGYSELWDNIHLSYHESILCVFFCACLYFNNTCDFSNSANEHVELSKIQEFVLTTGFLLNVWHKGLLLVLSVFCFYPHSG